MSRPSPIDTKVIVVMIISARASTDARLIGDIMKRAIAVILAGLALAAVCGSANAKGCVSGAAVGGVAGHVAGHHAVLGAAAGCVINHHRNKVKDEKAAAEAQRVQPVAQPAPPPSK